jgi:hypothetical protein
VPFSVLLISLASAVVGIWLISRNGPSDLATLLVYSGVVLAIPVAITAVFGIWQNGASGLIWTNYGVFFLPFSALAFWAKEFSSLSSSAAKAGAPYLPTVNDRTCAA